ncbi:hypothetical protein [Komagataeibacter europaeus]|uniref:hypothetical protein n=1 Tax=Komagataeibacter europaeus TaxID=33995 RepID=UPI0012FBB169|nr:hypothetical protein [Komagataeibacter europaeus]GBQ38888.1 hypothetical protein AA18890_0286 [Komagataeibacter europaeus LMG 18890]
MTFFSDNGGSVLVSVDLLKTNPTGKISLAYGASCTVSAELDADIRRDKLGRDTHIDINIYYDNVSDRDDIIQWLDKYTTPSGNFVSTKGNSFIQRSIDPRNVIANEIINYLRHGDKRPSVLRSV